MFKHISIAAFLLLASFNASAAFIYASDFDVGTDITQLTDNATLTYLPGGHYRSTAKIRKGGLATLSDYHFGGMTYGMFPAFYYQINGSPHEEKYSGLEIKFTEAVHSFAYKAESFSGTSVSLYLYDADGNYLKSIGGKPSITRTGAYQNTRYQLEDTIYFDVDVGKIIIGASSDPIYFYAMDVKVPEPTMPALLFSGLLFMLAIRRAKLFAGKEMQ